ncbi:MAG: VWA domain-containing protein, partial [Oleibacter sp.]|nr:VWA domain-containing protein [Thalassolituus sp.]
MRPFKQHAAIPNALYVDFRGIVASFFIVFVFLTFTVLDADANEETGSVAQSTAQKPADVRILIDISGSMKKTDPANLRRPALNLLAELLPEGSRGGVWTFGRYVNRLLPLDTVDNQWRVRAREASAKINSIAMNTNLVGALDSALLKTTNDDAYEQTVILLTDGKIDMDASEGDPNSPANKAERQRLMRDVLPQYTERNIRIHTLALSDGADQAVLQQIAMESGGLFLRAETAEQLLPAFLKAFDRAVPTEQVPMSNNQFSIDDSVREFTALIFRGPNAKPSALIAPDGQKITVASVALNENVRWHEDLNFDLVTIKSPQAGQWQADADIDPENRVQILSDLQLLVKGVPANLFAGVPADMEVALTNEGQVITESALLQLTDIMIQVTSPDGRVGSKLLSDPENLPIDGVFREVLSRLTVPGEYQVEVQARGRTFERIQKLTATLSEPMKINVVPFIEEQRASIRVTPSNDMMDTSLSRIIARIASPDGNSRIQAMDYDTTLGAWTLDLTNEKGDGEYEVVINIRGVSGSGMTFKSNPESLKLNFPITDADLVKETTEDVTTNQVTDTQTAGSNAEEVAQTDNESEIASSDAAKSNTEQSETEQSETEQTEESTVTESETELETTPWWVYTAIGVANLLLLGAVAWWWLARRRKANAENDEDELSGVDGVDGASDLTDIQDGDDDLDLDDDLDIAEFDDFDSVTEEPIPASSAVNEMNAEDPVTAADETVKTANDGIEGADDIDDIDDFETDFDLGDEEQSNSSLEDDVTKATASDEPSPAISEASPENSPESEEKNTISSDDDEDWGDFDIPDTDLADDLSFD